MIAVITGANTGLGFQTSRALARAGATVVMACRNGERAAQARALLAEEVPGASLVTLRLDVSEPESIRDFSKQFADRFGQVDLLINNAGVVGVPLARNSAGQEMHMATNYLGAFALTGRLLPLFSRGGGARVVNVGSLAHRLGRLDLDDLNWERGRYGKWRAYARSKLATLTFTLELDRRLRTYGGGVTALAAHPGFAATDIGKDSALLHPRNAIGRWLRDRIVLPRIPSAADAARPIVHAAHGEGARGGDYFGPGGWLEIAGAPAPARIKPAARNGETGRRLWALSEELTGVDYLSGV
jgi:NAD(P)-dependent dehydrogenase (short-subunit alcohol dehydrogenase family)